MPPASAHTTRKEFDRVLGSAVDVYKAISPFLQDDYDDTQGLAALSGTQARRVVGMAFLTVYVAWESFVEGVFLRYMVGAKAETGDPPQLLGNPCKSLSDARKALCYPHGKNGGRPSWTQWSHVEDRAKVYFAKGRPFTSLSKTCKPRLEDARIIRNRFVHSSETCKRKFKKVAQNFLGYRAHAPLPRGFGVGNLLVTAPKRHFGPYQDNCETIFLAYCSLLQDAAQELSPALISETRKGKFNMRRTPHA